MALLTEQMSAWQGLKKFGTAGVKAIMTELEQLLFQKVMHGVTPSSLTCTQKQVALQHLMFLNRSNVAESRAVGVQMAANSTSTKVKRTLVPHYQH